MPNGVQQCSPWQVSEEGEYDSPKSLRSMFESCNFNSSADMPRYRGMTAFGGTFNGGGSPFCCDRQIECRWELDEYVAEVNIYYHVLAIKEKIMCQMTNLHGQIHENAYEQWPSDHQIIARHKEEMVH